MFSPNHSIRVSPALRAGSVLVAVVLSFLMIARGEDSEVSALIEQLAGQDVQTKREAAKHLGERGPIAKAAIDGLITALKDSDPAVRWRSAGALGKIATTEAHTVLPALIHTLEDDPDNRVRRMAVEAIGDLRPKAEGVVRQLIKTLADEAEDPNIRVASANALEKIGTPEASISVPALLNAAKSLQMNVCPNSAAALGAMGTSARPAIPVLIGVLKDSNPQNRNAAAQALRSISTALKDDGVIDSLDQLTEIRLALESSSDPDVASVVPAIASAIASLESSQGWIDKRIRWISKHPLTSLVTTVYLVLIGSSVLILGVHPIRLFTINEWLRSVADFRIPLWVFGEIPVPVRYLLVFGFFHYHKRVLDSWVAYNISAIRLNFQELATVRDRSVHIFMPIELNSELIPGEITNDIRQIFAGKTRYLLMAGEGGSGKTSLACQIAKYAMSDSRVERIRDYYVIPVLIDALDFETRQESSDLSGALRRNLQVLIGSYTPISAQWVEHLIRQRRLLVILDQFSNLSAEAQTRIHIHTAEWPPQSLIVTSRTEKARDSLPKSMIQMRRIEGKHIFSFIDKYLEVLGRRDLFSNIEYSRYCQRLCLLAGEKPIPANLIKLYIDNMIASKERPEEVLSIPDLMILYLNELNDRARNGQANGLDDSIVYRTAKVIAWECVKEKYHADETLVTTILLALEGQDNDNSDGLLKFIEQRLQIIRTIEPRKESIIFTFPPLAEYLASLYLLETYGPDENEWQELLTELEHRLKTDDKVKGFLYALQDCWLADAIEPTRSSNVLAKLLAIGGCPWEQSLIAKDRAGRIS